MRVLNHQEIHAVSGSATTAAAASSSTNPFTYLLMGLFWGVAGLFGFSIIDFI